MLATSVVEEPESIKDNHDILQGVLEYFGWLDDYNIQDNVSELLSKWKQSHTRIIKNKKCYSIKSHVNTHIATVYRKKRK